MNKIISRSAILNNSYRFVQKLSQEINTNEIINIYSHLLELDSNPELDKNLLHTSIEEFVPKNASEKLFIVHARLVLQYHVVF